MSIIRIHLKISELISKSGFTHPDCILVGIRDFQAKLGWLDSLVTNFLPVLLYPTCTDLSPNQNPRIATASNIQNYHLSFHLLFLRSVAKMCRAAISNSFLRWATSCGQYRRRPSIPPTMFCE